MRHRRPSLKREAALWCEGRSIVAGIDEVGRGPLAGPVVAAAVVLSGTVRARRRAPPPARLMYSWRAVTAAGPVGSVTTAIWYPIAVDTPAPEVTVDAGGYTSPGTTVTENGDPDTGTKPMYTLSVMAAPTVVG